ncbi:Hydroxyproline O-galactosyltransferase GALT3 [Glycine soja]|uniref:Hydroxyproline O-galactosyltransferase GALT3 isoform C n=2 Tax=Glycine soja TaxID=3848 RepID=A0A445G1C8_GLYSO|nr:hydroxyproline O-galactosyltransferase GALT3 isoform X1 [Glycine soja]XP_028211139.1 hydroxyproline O-galactosyltransferase GALT3 isoform X1 [Glycine soja]XP_028211140.1 hydroxyproline O-galactosyltransferase GALT3 isoform X1 [Glycine soja]XP_028211141.1 hydroxyproline O-galactosyltransferase GALT3 isoform X1 [Glycine soja]XP_028211142.1 hydroxyproline O-galactosyltransferase GALT3 isoform X1 [Glycine soja]XP_040867234.1 hydroxyproline O-galactosyltransferase GALT3 isoform X1 [Glycine max]
MTIVRYHFKRLHFVQGLLKMKKWYGGLLIMALGMMLLFLYNVKGIQPQKQSAKQSAYNFFHNHTPGDSINGSSNLPVNSSEVELKRVTTPAKRPHLVHVAGLDDLYDMKNLSKEETNSVLIWDSLRSLLSRSDALAETAQGVKEASVAWKELLSIVEKDKASKINKMDGPENQNCPFSVTSPGKAVPDSGITLDLPCGLVVDSSITLIGIPNNRSFQIDLAGLEQEGEPNPPIILHYNVSLPGENMTEEPYIVQNTWTSDLGWGKEERCPARGSANIQEVDGLVLCNIQAVRSNNKGNANVDQPASDIPSNISSESVHRTANFPFAEGNPFTSTLWVGSEGFHMTVNGRHETSFAYREVLWMQKLEPWLVSSIKVAGSLSLLSILAKGLPVTEDNDIVVDIENLKAPSIARKRLALLIGVFSTGNNFERRMALRRSWMQYEAVHSGEVAVRFFIGLHKNNRVNFELWTEAQAYGDIQLMPFVDYYSLISLKTIAICIMGTKIIPSKYIMKTDDDAFVRIDEVLSSLKGKPSEGLLYGLISSKSSPQRDEGSKWYISEEEWPHDTYPPWAHGPGYVISRDIAKFIVHAHQERKLKLFKLEDVAMGIWIEQFKNDGKEVHYENDERFYNAGCESNYVIAHYQSPRMVLCLWEKLQKEHQPVCCE